MNKTTEALKLAEEALEELHYSSGTVKAVTLYKSALAAIREALAQPVKQEPVAFKFPREPKPENAMGWTIDYGLIRQIAEDIGDQEFHPGYEGIELTLMALEHIYTAQVPDRLAAAAHDLLKELQECRDLLKCVETCSRNNFENLADERVQAINAAIAAFKEKNK